jgi:NTE family protein
MSGKKPEKTINLALQGGGAHGAYTWGVLERLLEDERIGIEGISGTSAGAMNAAVLASGFAKDGYEGARQALYNFWRAISDASLFSPLQQTPVERMLYGYNLDGSPLYAWYDIFSRLFSPYEFNPMNLNPMRDILTRTLDIDALNNNGIRLFITATSVRTGQPRIFKQGEISVDCLMASACLPFIYQAVEVDGEAYWDGGYSGNPALWPLIYHCKSHDIMLVQINPFVREEVPKSANEIVDRLNEISFNSPLIGELRAIRFVARLVEEDKLGRENYKALRMHIIYSPEELHNLNASSKMNAHWDFFLYLREIGRAAADAWLEKHYDALGSVSTFDFEDIFELKKKPAGT